MKTELLKNVQNTGTSLDLATSFTIINYNLAFLGKNDRIAYMPWASLSHSYSCLVFFLILILQMTILSDVLRFCNFTSISVKTARKSAACIAKSAIWQQGFELVIQNLC